MHIKSIKSYIIYIQYVLLYRISFFHSLKYTYSYIYNLWLKKGAFSVFAGLFKIVCYYLSCYSLSPFFFFFLSSLPFSFMCELTQLLLRNSAEFKSDCRIDYWVHRETHTLTHSLASSLWLSHSRSLSLIHPYADTHTSVLFDLKSKLYECYHSDKEECPMLVHYHFLT